MRSWAPINALLLESAGGGIYSGWHGGIVPLTGIPRDHNSLIFRPCFRPCEKKALNLLRRPSTPSKGKTLPVYCTELPLTAFAVAALSWTMAAMRVSARQLRLVDVRPDHFPTEQAAFEPTAAVPMAFMRRVE
jgi:hypothetical protein